MNSISNNDFMSMDAPRYTGRELQRLEEQAEAFNTALALENGGRRATNELGKDDFLKLLITQLQHQDPTKPLEDKEFIAQTAQFTALETSKEMALQLTAIREHLGDRGENQKILSFLGKEVDIYTERGTLVTGNVTQILLDANDGMGAIEVGGVHYSPSQVSAVRESVRINPSMRVSNPYEDAVPSMVAKTQAE